jgi:uncharacterized protein YndB with AHSA1/START domain
MNSNDASHGHDLSIAILVDQSPQEVFAAITDVRGWWSEGLEGESARPGDVFTYRHEDVHHSTHRSTHRVTEAVAGQRVVWHTVDAELTHSARPSEWTGTDVRFDIARRGDKTEVRFTHLGLVPEFIASRPARGGGRTTWA